jgi:hypothetical protein
MKYFVELYKKDQSLFFIDAEKWEPLKILFPMNFMVLESTTDCFRYYNREQEQDVSAKSKAEVPEYE